MTSLLTRPPAPSARTEAAEPGRPLVRTAVLAGLAAASAGVAVMVVLALAGWFAADAGRYGTTLDAVRVGVDGWLLAHGAELRLEGTGVGVSPLALTGLFGWFAFRAGRWATRRAGLPGAQPDLGAVATLVGLLATAYAVTALSAAVLAVHPAAEAHLLGSLGGGFVVAVLGGGLGAATATGLAREWSGRVPLWGRLVLRGAAATLLLALTASALLVGGALLVDLHDGANVLARLRLEPTAAASYTLVGLAFVPNAVLLGVAYLLGPGLAVGAGTVVSPTAVALGPLPAFPLLAALPDSGDTPAWTPWLLGVPVLAGLAGVLLNRRAVPLPRIDVAAAAGLGAGIVAASAATLLVWAAGGAAGPGRMAEVGADVLAVLLAAVAAFGGGGLVGGALLGWLSRRAATAAEEESSAR